MEATCESCGKAGSFRHEADVDLCDTCAKELANEQGAVKVREFHYVDGKLQIAASHPMFALLLTEAADLMERTGAKHFLATTWEHKTLGKLEIIVRRVKGKTVDEALTELRAENAKLREGLDYIAQLSGCNCGCTDCPECYARRTLDAAGAAKETY